MLSVRRRLLPLLLLVGLTFLALGGLGVTLGGSDDRYVEVAVGRPVRVNPLAARGSDAEDDLVALVFSGLMRVGADGTPQPDLAQSWELTADGRTYTFHLRPGLTWQDGHAVSADDIAFTISRIQSPNSGVSPPLAAAWAGMQVTAADSMTVLIRTPEPLADLLVRASVGIVPKHLEAQMAASSTFDVPPFDRAPIGTGPYRLASLSTERALLERHEGFALGAPRIEHIELRFAPDAAAQVEALRAGVASAALLPSQPVEGDEAAVTGRRELAAVPLTRGGYTALYLNTTRAPLTDVPLRRAIAVSVDRVDAATASGIRALVGESVIVPGSWAFQRLGPTTTDIEALWTASGWTRDGNGVRMRSGRSLTLELVTNDEPARVTLAQRIAEQLKARGVQVNVTTLPAARVITERLHSGNFDLAVFGWEAGADPDPYSGWHTSQAGAGGNIAGYRDAESDALLEAGRTTVDVAERVEMYGLFLRRFADQTPAVVLLYPQRPYVHPARLRGAQWGLLVTSGSRFHDVYRWRLD